MTGLKDLVKKLHRLQSYIDSQIYEREAETVSVILALLSGESCLFIGDAGAAKTQHIHMISELTGLSLFDTLLSESTKPDSIFGPTDVPALAKGRQRNKIDGYAPTSEILFFDEVFKANGIVLNPMLWLLNEHKYRNGDDGVIECPTMAVFAASNEIPSDEASRPIYDRFLIRHYVSYIKANTNLDRLFNSAIVGKNKVSRPEPFTKEEILRLRAAVKKVKVPRDLWSIAIKVRSQVQQATGVVISARRMVKAFNVVKAYALFMGKPVVELEHLSVLTNMFWDTENQVRKTRNIVLANVNAKQSDLYSYVETAQSIYDKAVNTGEIKDGLKKIMAVFKVTKEFSTQAGVETHRYVEDYARKLKGIYDQRKEMTITRLADDKDYAWYKLSESSSQVWSTKQLRSAGFKFRRNFGYWYIPAFRKNTDEKVSAKIFKVLGIRPKINKLGEY